MVRLLWFCCLVLGLLNYEILGQNKGKYIGKVVEVDTAKGILSLQVGKKSSAVEKLNLVRPDLPITDSLGNRYSLKDLKAGQTINAQLSDAGDVDSIRLANLKKQAKVIRVVPETRQLEVRFGKTNQAPFSLHKDLRVIRSQEPASLKDLKPNMKVGLEFLPEHNLVLSIRILPSKFK